MIREFWVENYRSIKERQTISFEASSKLEDCLSVEIKPGVRLNKLAVFYGANASGKTNMLMAMSNIFYLLFTPRNNREEKISAAEPFALMPDKATKMYVSFYMNKIRYDYKITYKTDHIIEEHLTYYPKGKMPALFYERKFVSQDVLPEINFGAKTEIKMDTVSQLRTNTLNNHTVLSTFAKISLREDAKPLADLYNWIKNYVHDINGDDDRSLDESLQEVCKDKRKKSFYKQMMQKADFNIVDFKPTTVPKNISERVRNSIQNDSSLPKEVKKKILSGIRNEIVFENKTANGSFYLLSNVQSAGTVQFLKELQYLYDMITANHIYFLDELNDSLYYDLLLYYLNIFLYNSDQSQLVFSTQELLLLSEDFINSHRDVIWITEKERDTAASVYNRADKFGLHKNLSLFNSYKNGRLGAKPELGSPFLNVD